MCFYLCGEKLIITQFSDPFLCMISTSLDPQYDKVGTVAMFVIVVIQESFCCRLHGVSSHYFRLTTKILELRFHFGACVLHIRL
jgi:hypothetical protein